MATKLFLVLCLAASFAACNEETDLINMADHSFSTALSENEMDMATMTSGLARGDSSIEITTTHWLTGMGMYQPILEMENADATASIRPSKRYVIEASGDAMSETYARGFSTLKLIYHSGTHKVTGFLTTSFYYGEVLELKFDGDVHTRLDGSMMRLQVDVSEAIFRTNNQVFELSYGEIIFLLPSQPEGALKMDINTSTTLSIP